VSSPPYAPENKQPAFKAKVFFLPRKRQIIQQIHCLEDISSENDSNRVEAFRHAISTDHKGLLCRRGNVQN
jgi:hypothetical protein